MSEFKRYDCSNGNAKFCYGCYQMDENPYGPWVQALDFDAAQSELSALREELAHSECMHQNYKIDAQVYKDALTAAEQRNAELERLASIAIPYLRKDGHPSLAALLDAALKPTESGASDKCTDCHGVGQKCMHGHSAHPDNWYDCETCKGSGKP